MISAVLNVVVRASDDERAATLRWAQRRLAKSSLPPEAAAELLDGLRGPKAPPFMVYIGM